MLYFQKESLLFTICTYAVYKSFTPCVQCVQRHLYTLYTTTNLTWTTCTRRFKMCAQNRNVPFLCRL